MTAKEYGERMSAMVAEVTAELREREEYLKAEVARLQAEMAVLEENYELAIEQRDFALLHGSKQAGAKEIQGKLAAAEARIADLEKICDAYYTQCFACSWELHTTK